MVWFSTSLGGLNGKFTELKFHFEAKHNVTIILMSSIMVRDILMPLSCIPSFQFSLDKRPGIEDLERATFLELKLWALHECSNYLG